MNNVERMAVTANQPFLDTDHVKITISDAKHLLEHLDSDTHAWDSRLIAVVERVEAAIKHQEKRRGR